MAMTLKALRINRNLDQKTAAGKLGVSVATLSSWENAVTFPTVPQIKKIEELYCASYGDIIFCPEDSVKPETFN